MIYKFTNFLQDNRGTALMMALLVLTSILVVSLGAANLVVSGLKMGGTQERSTVAYFAAEAGIERVLWEIRKNGFNTGGCAVGDFVDFNAPAACVDPATCGVGSVCDYFLSNGASYNIVCISNSPIAFKSIGSYESTMRAVEISY